MSTQKKRGRPAKIQKTDFKIIDLIKLQIKDSFIAYDGHVIWRYDKAPLRVNNFEDISNILGHKLLITDYELTRAREQLEVISEAYQNLKDSISTPPENVLYQSEKDKKSDPRATKRENIYEHSIRLANEKSKLDAEKLLFDKKIKAEIADMQAKFVIMVAYALTTSEAMPYYERAKFIIEFMLLNFKEISKSQSTQESSESFWREFIKSTKPTKTTNS